MERYLIEHRFSGINLTTGCVDEDDFDYLIHINKFYVNTCKIILFSYSSIAAQITSSKKRSENAGGVMRTGGVMSYNI